ncbi:C40 family peptidase [Micromonosporaceae bacterium Da 78-11]
MSRSVPSMLRRLALIGVAVAALTSGNLVVPTTAAHASTVSTARTAPIRPTVAAARAARMRSYRIVAFARAQQGKPYRFGAAGPSAFDCSGLSGYAYRQVNLRLPRTAGEQYRVARPVSRAAARPGDLVFWVSGGRAYHVGVYAGGGQVWHAPKPGSRVKLATVWSPGEVRYGRIGI